MAVRWLRRVWRRLTGRRAIVIQFPPIQVEDPMQRLRARIDRWKWCTRCGTIVVAGECEHTEAARAGE
jgi:hypothetical protein